MRRHIGATALLLCFFCLLPLAHAEPQPKYIALTFDDGPAGKITKSLLDGLAERDVEATFFLCCYRITQYPELVQRMAEDGHEMGVHGCSHTYFTQLSKKQLEGEILTTAQSIKDLTGTAPTLLRPPGGLYNEAVRQTAEEHDFSVILWNVDPEDWDPRQRKNTVRRVLQKAKDGDIVLLHDLSMENVESILKLIDELKKDGFHFCTVSELAARTGRQLQPGGVYTAFP